MALENVIIIGSGPAGYTAAIYTARANLNPLLIEGYQSGGLLMLTSEVENYPGFPKGIVGPELMSHFRAQCERFGTRFIQKDCTGVDFKGALTVKIDNQSLEAKTVILSTGASTKWLGLESEQRLLGKGVSSCATCDGAFFKGARLIVVGGGDSAMEEANFLTRFASHVTVIHRRDSLRASKIMQDRAKNNSKISFIWNTGIEEILGSSSVTGARTKNLTTGAIAEVPCEGFFVAIGHDPNTGFLKGQVELDNKGYVVLKNRPTTATNVRGVFACGDVQDTIYRQAVTAAGSGCQSAIDAERFLESIHG